MGFSRIHPVDLVAAIRIVLPQQPAQPVGGGDPDEHGHDRERHGEPRRARTVRQPHHQQASSDDDGEQHGEAPDELGGAHLLGSAPGHDQPSWEATMFPAGSSRNAVSPELFHTAEPWLHQWRSVAESVPQPVRTVTLAPASMEKPLGNE